jgi:hypothetical protein
MVDEFITNGKNVVLGFSGLMNHLILMVKRICFHLFEIEEIMMDGINLITDPGSRDKRSRH